MTRPATAEADWRHRAACLDATGDLWFAPEWEREPERTWRINDAKAICDTCPVKDTCLQWALDENIDHGVWGGLSEDERRAMKRAAARRRTSPTIATRPTNRKPPAPDTRAAPTDRPTCGTDSGYREHTRKHERQCDACRTWKQDTRRNPTPPACGTLTGYRHHQTTDEPACDPCKTAKATDSADYRQRQRSTAA